VKRAKPALFLPDTDDEDEEEEDGVVPPESPIDGVDLSKRSYKEDSLVDDDLVPLVKGQVRFSLKSP